jgi:cytochrome c oxidase accessory protein FixG
MFDKDTLIITYDAARGEPRGSRSKKVDAKAAGLGACVDCTLCVQVCPTGIDIRKGLQYECIGCAACIDVCDSVMDKMGYARGLVRYTTQNGLEGGWTRAQMWRRALRPRVLIYTAILILIVAALGVSIAMRSPFKVDVVRDRASLARIVEDGVVENVYRLQIMNATESAQSYQVTVAGLPGLRVPLKAPVTLASAEARWITVAVQLPPESAGLAGSGAHTIFFDVQRLEAVGAAPTVLREKSTFVIPR